VKGDCPGKVKQKKGRKINNRRHEMNEMNFPYCTEPDFANISKQYV
jgi:hypothetical protein